MRLPAKDWFFVSQYNAYIYIIREHLDLIEPRFLTKFTNMYLVVGSKSALLIDTGAGLYPIKPLIDRLIGERKLFVVNSHSDFDHCGSNNEFKEIYIHKKESHTISKPYDISSMRDSPNQEYLEPYKKRSFVLQPAKRIIGIDDGHTFDLGGITLKTIHTPGHSPGSICLLSNHGDLFTSDTVIHGAVYLPPKEELSIFRESLVKLMDATDEFEYVDLLPSHEYTPIEYRFIRDLLREITNIEISDKLYELSTDFDAFLDSWIIDVKPFKLIIPRKAIIR